MPDLAAEIELGYERGWSFTPLTGKAPRLKAWQTAARESLEQALAWAAEGNVGLRTGWTSGIAVIDDDTGGAHGLELPETWTVETGGRTADGRPRLQHYYLVRGLVRNYAGTLAAGIDVRGQGGQVVFVGSIHPETGETYRWAPGRSPMDVPLAEFPVELLPEERDRELYRVAELVAAGRTHREIAAELGVSPGTIHRALPPADAGRERGAVRGAAPHTEHEAEIKPGRSAPRTGAHAPRTEQGSDNFAGRERPAERPAPRVGRGDDGPLGGRLGEREQSRRLTAYAQSGFRAELARVRAAPEGARNDTLNQAAFNVGRHVAAGTLDRAEVVEALADAARTIGLRDGEIRATIESGLRSAERDPCFAPPGGWHERRRPAVVFAGADGETYPTAPEADDKPWVLAPGSHVDDQGEYHEVGAFSFAERVLDALPEDLIYRKSGVAGRLRGSPGRREFAILKDNSARLLIDQTARVGVWVKIKDDHGDKMHLAFKACTKDLGAVLTQHACDSERVRDLDLLVSYPVFLPGWGMAPTGYAKGVYYDPPEELHGLQAIRDVDTIRATLEDLVVDFPFASPADRENFIGLLLTPIVRPALEGNTPMHLVLSSLERTGKTKLIEQVFGHTILGTALPSTPLAEQEEERQKAVLSMLLAGDTIVALDNMNESVDSPTLAALLTSRVFAGRLLGQTQMLKLANTITLVGTANNLSLSGELAKRTIPIRLQPTTDHPENRTDFQHPDLLEYLRGNRVRVLRCLVGMVLNWLAAGRPRGRRLGGFEAWSESVGGILAYHGWSQWRTNEAAWRQNSDEHGADLLRLVNAWAVGEYANDTLRASTLLEIAEAHELFTGILRQSSPRGRLAAFGSKVLRRHVDTPVGGFYIRREGNSAQTWYKLERVGGRG